MFVELVQGTAADPAVLEERWDQTLGEIAAEAVGWLGATSGVTADGRFVAMLGFASEEAARITMDRLDRRASWERLAPVIADRTFRECPNVRAFGSRDLGDPDLVQVTHGPANDIERIVAAFERSSRSSPADETAIGGLLCWDEAGFAASALYLRSSEAGAAGTADVLARDAAELFDQPVRLDLAGPWSILAGAEPPPRDDDRPVPA